MTEPLDTFLWSGAAALNLLLAWLVLSARPVTTVHRLIAVVFIGNAIPLVGFVAADAGLLLERHVHEWSRGLDLITVLALLALPLAYTRRLGRGAWTIMGAASLIALTAGAYLTYETYQLWATNGGRGTTWSDHGFLGQTLLTHLPFRLAHIVGIVVFLSVYLDTPHTLRRRQAQFFLAAYLLSAATWTFSPLTSGAFVGIFSLPYRLFLFAALFVPILAVPVALASRRLRRSEKDTDVRGHLFVLAAAAAGFLLAFVPDSPRPWGVLTPWLLRPLLLAYGLLQFQLLDSELRARLPLLYGTMAAGLATVFAATGSLLGYLGADAVTTVGLALLCVAIVASVFAAPIIRLAVAGDASRRERNLDVYRAALVGANGDASGAHAPILSALRASLGLSEREHALLTAEVDAARGEPSRVHLGTRFLGRYRVKAPLGQGGFARTYLARDERVGREIVLKVSRVSDAAQADLMMREAQALARLRHPHVLTIHDVEEVGDEVVMVLEHLEGGSLAARLQSGPLNADEVAVLAQELLAALAAVHEAGIVHRDLKPANVLFTRDGHAKLADFGVAHLRQHDDTVAGLSMDGLHPGSLRYMSPEQVRGLVLDGRSDLYSLGVVLHEALTGEPWLQSRGNELDARVAVLKSRPRLPIAGVPKTLNDLLRALLQGDRERRPRNAEEAMGRVPVAVPAPRGVGPQEVITRE